MEAIKIRELRPEDESFIYSTWLKSFKNSKYTGPIPNHLYWPFYSEVIKYLLGRCKTLVACNPENEKQVFGYIVYEDENIIHWVYVKRDFRRWGIGKKLHTASGVGVGGFPYFYTFKTDDCSWFFPYGKYLVSAIKKKDFNVKSPISPVA
jgi:hypothetical protein